jgi:hypothetical protein
MGSPLVGCVPPLIGSSFRFGPPNEATLKAEHLSS